MRTLIEIGLCNIAMAAALALVAVIVGRTFRRPALTHSLWLLVLIKLITPPLFFVPLPFLTTKDAAAADKETEVAVLPEPELPRLPEELPPEALIVLPEIIEQVVPAQVDNVPPEPVPQKALAPPAPTAEPRSSVAWSLIGAGIWILGAVCWVVVASVRLRRFRRLLVQAQPAAQDLQDEVNKLATKFQVRCPVVRLVHGPLSPMIWVLGTMRCLLVPAQLLDRLNAQQRSALLAHELAHLRRKDPWVRYLEMIVLGLYWWCPLVWWALRELREAEEECCDAWVLWALPESARAYALALVETVDFLAEARPALPVLASGFGHVTLLRRRLTMIMRGSTPRSLTATGIVLLLAVAALLVPWLPTWGQAPAAKEDPSRAILETLQKLQKMQADLQKQQAALEEQRQAVEAKARELAKALKVQKIEKKVIIEFTDDYQKPKVAVKAPPATKEVDQALLEKIATLLMKQQGQGRPDMDRRLAELERNLGNIVREVQNMRRELQGGPGMQPRFGPPMKGPTGPQPGGFRPGPGGFGPFPPGNLPPGPNAGPGGGFPPGPGTGPGGGLPQPNFIPDPSQNQK